MIQSTHENMTFNNRKNPLSKKLFRIDLVLGIIFLIALGVGIYLFQIAKADNSVMVPFAAFLICMPVFLLMISSLARALIEQRRLGFVVRMILYGAMLYFIVPRLISFGGNVEHWGDWLIPFLASILVVFLLLGSGEEKSQPISNDSDGFDPVAQAQKQAELDSQRRQVDKNH